MTYTGLGIQDTHLLQRDHATHNVSQNLGNCWKLYEKSQGKNVQQANDFECHSNMSSVVCDN